MSLDVYLIYWTPSSSAPPDIIYEQIEQARKAVRKLEEKTKEELRIVVILDPQVAMRTIEKYPELLMTVTMIRDKTLYILPAGWIDASEATNIVKISLCLYLLALKRKISEENAMRTLLTYILLMENAFVHLGSIEAVCKNITHILNRLTGITEEDVDDVASAVSFLITYFRHIITESTSPPR